MSIDDPILSDPPSDDDLAKRLEIAVDEFEREVARHDTLATVRRVTLARLRGALLALPVALTAMIIAVLASAVLAAFR